MPGDAVDARRRLVLDFAPDLLVLPLLVADLTVSLDALECSKVAPDRTCFSRRLDVGAPLPGECDRSTLWDGRNKE